MTEALRSILERVEAADGASREIDAEIFCALNTDEVWTPSHLCEGTRHSYGAGFCFKNIDRYGTLIEDGKKAPEWTASIDLAVALVEKILPLWIWSVSGIDRTQSYDPVAGFAAELAPTRMAAGGKVEAYAATPALALIAALLRALDASPPHSGAGKP